MDDRRESWAILLILVAVLAYSGLPVLGAYSLDILDPFVFVAKSFFQYSLLQAGIWLLWSFFVDKRFAVPPDVLPRTRQTYVLLGVAGGLIAASYSCLFTSFYFVNKAGASILYETWPIFVVIGLPLFVRQRFERLSATDIAYVALAFVGVTLIISASSETMRTPQQPIVGVIEVIGGFTLAAASGVTMAIAVIIKTHLMRKLLLGRAAIPAVAFVESSHRFIGAAALIAIAMVSTGVSMEELFKIDISTAFALMELVGASAFWFAIIATHRSTINVLWYLAPMLAIAWLSLIGLAQVNLLMVIGAVLIIAANILATRRRSAGDANSNGERHGKRSKID